MKHKACHQGSKLSFNASFYFSDATGHFDFIKTFDFPKKLSVKTKSN